MTVSLQTAPNFGVLAVAFLAVGRNPDVDAYPGHLEQTLMSLCRGVSTAWIYAPLTHAKTGDSNCHGKGIYRVPEVLLLLPITLLYQVLLCPLF